MRRLFVMAALALIGTSAQAAEHYSFQIGGKTVHIEVPNRCADISCITVNVPGVNLGNLGGSTGEDVPPLPKLPGQANTPPAPAPAGTAPAPGATATAPAPIPAPPGTGGLAPPPPPPAPSATIAVDPAPPAPAPAPPRRQGDCGNSGRRDACTGGYSPSPPFCRGN